MTSQRLAISSFPLSIDQPQTLRFLDPVSLRAATGGPSGLLLDASLGFEVVAMEPVQLGEQWSVAIRTYRYRLLDHDYRELLVYHWQPGPDFQGPDHPHLHISAALDAQLDAMTRREIGLDKLHLATGHVSLAAFIRMLITEFGVAPLRHDWRDVLDRTDVELRAASGNG